MSDLFNPLTTETMRLHLLAAGYRAELITDPVAGVQYLRSATSGLTFDVRMGNALANEQLGHADATFVAVLNIVGEFPLGSINTWNCTRRFGRLQIDSSHPDHRFLVLCMDVVVAGGISRQNLDAHIAIWDGLVQQLIAWLREEIAKVRATDVAVPDAPISAGAKTAEANLAAGANA